MKITIVTVVWNRVGMVRGALESVADQRREGFELEHIVVDGGSTDGTVDVIRPFAESVRGYSFRWLSEKDRGLYDAINKGIRMATGDIVGILNSDDVLAADDVLAKIAAFWSANPGLDLSYGDVRFAVRGEYADARALRQAKTLRYLTGCYFRKWMFRFATFPAHPSTFVRRACYERYGLHSLEYSICADFELMLRLFVKHNVRAAYLPLCTTVMRPDGLSTDGLRSKFKVNAQDLAALRANGVWSCLPLIYAKYLFKIWGYFRRKA